MDFDSEESEKKDLNKPNEKNSCLFLHTSGTTSRPKGVPLKHKNLLKSLKNIVDTYELDNNDIAMVVMPLFHVHGLIGVALATLSSGGEIIIPEKFSAGAFWKLQKKHNYLLFFDFFFGDAASACSDGTATSSTEFANSESPRSVTSGAASRAE